MKTGETFFLFSARFTFSFLSEQVKKNRVISPPNLSSSAHGGGKIFSWEEQLNPTSISGNICQEERALAGVRILRVHPRERARAALAPSWQR
ncbi:hypothetical protein SADUNF_Sadunf16G0136500 [Salix dunnii]|uniref:Uncharacterized protein n=1 Tax=Salix dunnii TaxID=1413687 RepID=A0A835J6P0_9ROSI|nr:hypothetical protein SADUNF_Sadunf16G0136500 [Salix dunnii]